MQQPGSSYPPGGSGHAKRRGLFAGKGAEQQLSPGDTRLEAMMASYQQVMMERIEEGLRAIQQTGITLMHEIAGEVWRTARGDKDEVQARILGGLARDQAIRGLIAHSDERFQALAVRTARLEDTLAQMAESTRALKEVVGQGARALHDAATSPTFQGVEEIRERMVEIEGHLQATFERLDERDRILIGNLQEQIRDHGLVLRQETGRIVEALEGYVKDGVDAMGRLAQHIEQQSERAGERSESVAQQLSGRFEEQAQRFEERAQHIEQQSERAGERSEAVAQQVAERSEAVAQQLSGRFGEQAQQLSERFEEQAQRFDERARHFDEQTEAARTRAEEITRRLWARFEEQAQHIDQQTEAARTRAEEMTERLTATSGEMVERLTATSGEMARRLAARFEEQAQRLEEQNALTLTRSEEIIGRLAGTVGEQIQLMYDRIGVETRALTEAFKSHETWILRTLEASSSRFDEGMEAQVEKVRQASREVAGDLARTFENRVYGLAELVRSDSEVLRRQLRDAAAAQSEEMAAALDERLGRVSEALSAATRWTVEEITGRIGRDVEEMTSRIGTEFAEMTSRIGTEFAETTRRSNEENSRALQGRLDDVVTSIDRNMVRLADTLDSELDRLGQSVGQRSAQAAEAAIEGRFDRTLERLNATIESVGRIGEQVERLERVTEDVMNRNLDDRIGALARMIRSDNRILAERMQTAADQEPAKQALRAVKELQASMPADMMEVMDRRFAALTEQLHRDTQAMAESVAKAGEVIGQKVDRIAAQISQRSDRDMQMVIERMGDAMHALASLGKQDQPRIELE